MRLSRVKLIVIICVVIGVALGVYGVFYYIRQLNNVHITVSVVPSDATITFNGSRFRNGGVWLKPGKYTVEVSRDGFSSYKSEQDFAGGDTFITSLLPESQQAQEWFDKNQDQYKKQEDLSNELSDTRIEATMEQYPDLQELPIVLPVFTIEYRFNEKNEPVIHINAYDGSRNAAIAELDKLGINPASYRIQFNNYSNPFKEGSDD